MYYELQGTQRFAPNGKCPVCNSNAYLESAYPPTPMTMAVCGVCGKFRYDDSVEALLKNLHKMGDNRLYKLSHVLRSVSGSAREIRDNSLFPVYSSDDFERMLDRPDPSVQEKLTALLIHLSNLSAFPGDRLEFDGANDYSVLCAKNAAEANFYMRSLHNQGLLADRPLLTQSGTTFSLSSNGWIELDKLARSGGESSNAFVAMWFDPSRKPFFEVMSRAISDAGYFPIRVDLVEHANRIDDEIISQIRQSRVLVADLSGQRNGVYFEAGFMLGLGRPVIWVCEKRDLQNVHFDTRQFNTIDYEDADDLKSRLQFRIEAILGKGPRKAT